MKEGWEGQRDKGKGRDGEKERGGEGGSEGRQEEGGGRGGYGVKEGGESGRVRWVGGSDLTDLTITNK